MNISDDITATEQLTRLVRPSN